MSCTPNSAQNPIGEAIGKAEEVLARDPGKPRLLVNHASPDEAVVALRDILAGASGVYDRGVPVRVYESPVEKTKKVQVLRPEDLVFLAHKICRPYALKERGDGWREEDVRLPRTVADMYLGWHGERRLPVLNGIACSPLLRDDGSFHGAEGYDATTGHWCERIPDVSYLVPQSPTAADAADALHLLRQVFRTICFADASMIVEPESGLAYVDTSVPPGADESSFLAALITAVCRASLDLAPGIVIRAASISGAGAGKGLLARCISIVAFGREPAAVSAGGSVEEIEKRIGAELMEASPVLLLDNLNNRTFKSDLLASVLTERPARVRLLGRSQMVPLNSSALIVLTGNGLLLSEDLARRFVIIELDPRTEDPENRPFRTDLKRVCRERRAELLAAALTIWRWGRQTPDLERGVPIGSYEEWARWVRDPLFALGCADPVVRISETKARDDRRSEIAEIFEMWWARHADQPVAAKNLHEDVRQALNPLGLKRQFLATRLQQLAGTRIAGWVLLRQAAIGKHGAATYVLQNLRPDVGDGGTGGHQGPTGGALGGYAPYAPYAFPPRDENQCATSGQKIPCGLEADHRGPHSSGQSCSENCGGAERHRGHRGHTTVIAQAVVPSAEKVVREDGGTTAPIWRKRL